MDQQKTGELISLRRKQLELTQKELADKLGISDRTVSKWERGIGFPDVSLIEDLADALELTVLELFHGQQESTPPEQESSVRETLQTIQPQIQQMKGRSRRWIIALTVLLIALIAALPWLFDTAVSGFYPSQQITSSEATAITPMILITGQDSELMNALLRNDRILEIYSSQGQQWDAFELTADEEEHYLRLLNIGEKTPDFLNVWVGTDHISVTYGTDYICVYLEYRYGMVDNKTVMLSEYPYRESGQDLGFGDRHGNWVSVSNKNNEDFSKNGYQTGWLEYFRTTYY